MKKRKQVYRKLRRNLRTWQGAALVLIAVLLTGAGVGGLTGSNLFINADTSTGDKVVMKVGSDELIKVSSDGTTGSVTLSGSHGFADDPNDRFRVPRLAADPVANLSDGMIYYNTTNDIFRVYRNGAWEDLGGGGAPSESVLYSDSPNDSTLIAAGYVREPMLDSPSVVGSFASGTEPLARSGHTAVWTGSEMIVWGGRDAGGSPMNTGGRYDPDTDTWQPTTTTGAPVAREYHTAVWTGSEMIVWGGSDGTNKLDDGARYDPLADTWSPVSSTGSPTARQYHTAVWSGTEMIVWGGSGAVYLNDGKRYNPSTDSWSAVSATGAPTARFVHTAVWVSGVMVVWGGFDGSYLNTGGVYDPTVGPDGTWSATTTTSAPSARYTHSAVSTGSEMLIWGGTDGTRKNDGFIYDPSGDTWTAMDTSTAPTARNQHTAVWTGSEMLIWGGSLGASNTNTGARYNPVGDSWQAITLQGAPGVRKEHASVWTGSEMLVWGGDDGGRLDDGGRYTPGATNWGVRAYAYRAP